MASSLKKTKLESQTTKKKFKLKNHKVLLGFILILIGLVLILPALRPYLHLTFSKPTDEIAHPPGKIDTIKSGSGDIIKSRGKIFIPSIKLAENLLEGVSKNELDNAIGHYPGKAWPGEKSNIVFTGHNYFRQSPLFSLLNYVRLNDPIIIHYEGKRYEYQVTKYVITKPNKLNYYRDIEKNRLTLITCYPPNSTAMRLIVLAELRR